MRGLPVRVTGVDVKQQSADHNTAVAADARHRGRLRRRHHRRRRAARSRPTWCSPCTPATPRPTTRWPGRSRGRRPLVLAAPCCHHDIAAQLRKAPTPAPYAVLTRHGILRERFADTLTDALRAAILRLVGYRVDVVEFVGSEHTPRNTLLRATRTGKARRRRRPAARVRRPGGHVGSAPAPRRAAGPLRVTDLRRRVLTVAAGAALAAPFAIGLAAGRGAGRRPGALHLRGPRDRRVERAGGRRRPGLDDQRLRRHRPGLHRRHRDRRDRRGHLLGRRPGRRRGARPGRTRAGLGGRHRRQHRARGTRSRSPGCRSATGTARSTRRRSTSSTPTAPATPRRCWSTRRRVASTS